MIYKLIKDMLKYSVLKDYIIRDSFFTFIPFAFIIYKNSKYFISSIYFLDDSVYSLALLNINSLRIFLEGFLIILIFVKTIYLRGNKKSSFLLLIYFYVSNLNCYIVSYFNSKLLFYSLLISRYWNLLYMSNIINAFYILFNYRTRQSSRSGAI